MSGKKDTKPLLAGHRRQGKRFIPPFLDWNLQEVRWIHQILPELLWIGLLNEHWGLRDGAELARLLSRATHSIAKKPLTSIYGLASAYICLAQEEQEGIRDKLKENDALSRIQIALHPLLTYYPECPLRFIGMPHTSLSQETSLVPIKNLILNSFDRGSAQAMFMQANVLYLAFDVGTLHVMSGLSLENFPAVQDYPHTEESCRVAASIRATVSFMFGTQPKEIAGWSRYFWRRGTQLEPCYSDEDTDE